MDIKRNLWFKAKLDYENLFQLGRPTSVVDDLPRFSRADGSLGTALQPPARMSSVDTDQQTS